MKSQLEKVMEFQKPKRVQTPDLQMGFVKFVVRKPFKFCLRLSDDKYIYSKIVKLGSEASVATKTKNNSCAYCVPIFF